MLYKVMLFLSDFFFPLFVFLIIQFDLIRYYIPNKHAKAKKILGNIRIALDIAAIPLALFQFYNIWWG